MGFQVSWIFKLIPFSTRPNIIILFIVFALFQALFYVGLSLLYCSVKHRLALFPFCWVLCELARSYGYFGSTHFDLGYSQVYFLSLLQYASLGGLYFVSFLCVTINVIGVYLIINYQRTKHFFHINHIYLSLGMILFFIFSMFTSYVDVDKSEQLTIGLVQGNHEQLQKLNKHKRPLILQDYVTLSEQLLQQQSIDLIIWPEIVINSLLQYNTKFLTKLDTLATHHDTSFLFGLPRKDKSQYYNSSALLQPHTSLLFSDKTRLMPFGEFWPLKPVFKFFNLDNIIPGSEFSVGKPLTTLPFKNQKLAIGICLESTYPSFFRSLTQQGATMLIAIANSAWFYDSWISKSHFNMGIMRAVENGRPFLQCSNIGISGVVSATGQVLAQTQQNKQELLTIKVPITSKTTLFTRFGHWIGWFSCLIILVNFLVPYFQKNRS